MEQLELSLDSKVGASPAQRHERRIARARWWFEQMHKAVDNALSWNPAPPPPPEQTRLVLAVRGD